MNKRIAKLKPCSQCVFKNMGYNRGKFCYHYTLEPSQHIICNLWKKDKRIKPK